MPHPARGGAKADPASPAPVAPRRPRRAGRPDATHVTRWGASVTLRLGTTTRSERRGMQVVALDHAAIKTDRLEETRRFFEEVLGLRVGPRPDFDFPGYWLYAGDRDVVHLVETDSGKA